uniref:Zinc finger, C2H2 type n=1 Tax=Globodera pallida TaxID=36090 RepID=A0A183C865_GLOPA
MPCHIFIQVHKCTQPPECLAPRLFPQPLFRLRPSSHRKPAVTPLPHPNAVYASTHPAAVYASTASSSTATELFIDTMSHHTLSPKDDHPSSSSHVFRTQHEHWLRCARDERNSTSSSDSGLPPSAGPFPLSPSFRGTRLSPRSVVASSFSSGNTLMLPPAPGSASSLSPLWLSQLHIADSAFNSATTTPYSSASVPPSSMSGCALVRVHTADGSRFRFDHLLPPPPAHATMITTATGETAAAAPPFATHSLLPLAPSSLQLLGGPALSSLTSSSGSASSATVLAPSTSGMATQQKTMTTTVRKELQQKLEVRVLKKMSVLSHAEVVGTAKDREDNDKRKEEDKQFICNVCNKDFGRADMLTRHLRCHTGEKPFGCGLCGRFFSRADHLQSHKLTHSNEKPYQCAMCPYAARRCDVLTRHLRIIHKKKATHSFFVFKKPGAAAATARKGQCSSSSPPPGGSQAAATGALTEQK